jgi:hypothetical protein
MEMGAEAMLIQQDKGMLQSDHATIDFFLHVTQILTLS